MSPARSFPRRPRRPRRLALLVVIGALLGGTLAVRRNRGKRADRRPQVGECPGDVPVTADPEPADLPQPEAPEPDVPKQKASRSEIRLAVAVVLIFTLLVTAVVGKRLADTDRTVDPDTAVQTRESLVDRTGVAVRDPGVPAVTAAPEPPTGVEPDTLASDGVSCEPGAGPVLNTVRPVLTARMATSVPVSFEIKKLGSPEYAGGEQTARDGLLAMYFRGPDRLQPGRSYRWRIHDEAADIWTPSCEFTIAAHTTDSLDLDENRPVTVSMPPARWRDVAGVLGPGWPHGDTPWFWSVEAAGAQEAAGAVPVSLRGWDWGTVIDAVAEAASARNDPHLWRLVDALSTEAGGPPHPTLGYPRA
ncbi:hypothetical protein [Actinoplanes utahensis]|uniref:Uncharacterized protein n=1 Tax=Actinoplanes utahensis TaxID=1869 RepID=A0A0A6USY4_ACTUT|nr:hypothetical protein [Actinoplanes utahensis]KHD77584.1 hypothetical protein MB27_10925 [Actinoplanes utahensis]GIF32777.1 hypothetical protein Aut01nite_57630 [Actinoplanes utahensis]